MSSDNNNNSAIAHAFNTYFSCLGSTAFATALSRAGPFLDLSLGEQLVVSAISDREVLQATSHHGNIGEKKAALDARAAAEQGAVDERNEQLRMELLSTGKEYLQRHGVKYMIFASGKTGAEMLAILKARINNTTEEEWRAARMALWQIFCKRVRDDPTVQVGADVVKYAVIKNEGSDDGDNNKIFSAALSASWGNDVQLAYYDSNITNNNSNSNNKSSVSLSEGQPRAPVGTFGRAISSIFVLEYLQSHNIALTDSADEVLSRVGSTFRLGNSCITIEDIVGQSALEAVTASSTETQEFDDPLQSRGALLDAAEMGSLVRLRESCRVEGSRPSTSAFVFSDANFILLQHIIQMHAMTCRGAGSGAAGHMNSGGAAAATASSSSSPSLASIAAPFFTSMGLTETGYCRADAVGEKEKGAGASSLSHGLFSTVHDLHRFMVHLGRAYHDIRGSAGISHDTARKAVYGFNRDFDFMHTYIGGAGAICTLRSVDGNKFIVNYGGTAERSFYSMHCFDGADKGKSFVVGSTSSSALSNQSRRDLVNCDMAKACIKQLALRGFDESSSSGSSNSRGGAFQNQRDVYRSLITSKFTQERAEPIVERGPKSDFLSRSFLCGATVAFCSNDKFARAENLVSDCEPLFDPVLFGRQGKVMDSWESVRHCIRDFDEAVFDIAAAAADDKKKISNNDEEPIRYVYLSTMYHTGNQTPVVAVSAKVASSSSSSNPTWQLLLPKIAMSGHSYRCIDLLQGSGSTALLFKKKDILQIRAEMYPDGGWTRLALFGESDLSAAETAKFQPLPHHLLGTVQSTRHSEPVPAAVKPLVEEYKTTPAEVAARLAREIAAGAEYDAACQKYGGYLVSASDQHYAPATHALSPHPPAGMFDGMETARSRRVPLEASFEEIKVGLLQPTVIHRIEVDCTFFVNNAPREIQIIGLLPSSTGVGISQQQQQKEIIIVPRQKVKHFSGGVKEFITTATCTAAVEALIVKTFPCGGFNRLRAFTFRR